MKARVIVAGVAMALAVIVGFTTPEPSTAIIYRAMLIGFALLTISSRIVSMGAMTAAPSTFPSPTAKSLRPSPRHNPPLFVTDPGFAIAPRY